MVIFNLNLHGDAHLRVRGADLDRRLSPGLVLLQGQRRRYHGVIAIGNPFLWWLATLCAAGRGRARVARRSYAVLPVAAIILVLYLPWFATSRTSFLYYMTPVAPFLAILVAVGPLPVRRRDRCRDARLVRRGRSRARRRPCSWQPRRPSRRGLALLDAAAPRRGLPRAGWAWPSAALLGARRGDRRLLSPRLRP